MPEITREQMVGWLRNIRWYFFKSDIKMLDAITAVLERKCPTISKMPYGWWLHLTGKDGKMADVFLGPEHGPIVEAVLRDNAKGDVPIFNEEGHSNENA